jgi:hypothetical protein
MIELLTSSGVPLNGVLKSARPITSIEMSTIKTKSHAEEIPSKPEKINPKIF